MQTRALLVLLGVVSLTAAKPSQQPPLLNHEWLSPSRSMVTVVAVERKCPSVEFELLNNDTCIKTVEIPAEVTCSRSSATVQDSMCVTTEFFPPERVCPANAVFNGEECDIFNIQSVNTQCDKGDELVNGECWRYENRSATYTCPKNYQLKGDRCVFTATTTPDLVCPPDFRMNSDELCVKTDIQAVQPDCPENSVYHNGLCLSELGLTAAKARPLINLNAATTTTSGGPLGGRSAGGTSSSLLLPELPHNIDAILTPSKRCVSGGELDDQGRCVSITSVEADIVCPSGYAMNNGRCDKPVTASPSYRCPANFVLQGDLCVQTVPAEPYCNGEKETLTTSGTCISLHSEPPIRSCPQRSMMSPDGRCAVQVIYENDLELYCDPNNSQGGGGGGMPRLRSNTFSPPIASYALVNDVCVKVIKNRHVMICPQNYIFSQNQCVLSQSMKPSAECRNATFDPSTKQCVSTTAVDQLIQCPKGFEIDSNSKSCRLKKTYHPQLSCQDGFVLKKKPRSSGSKDSPGAYECHHHQKISAEMTCGDLGELENGTCVHKMVNEPIKTCKEGFTLNLEGLCQQTIETLVIKSCPTDYKQVGNACVGKVPTETQTLTNEDRRLLIDALQGFIMINKNKSQAGGGSGSGGSGGGSGGGSRKKSDLLTGLSAAGVINDFDTTSGSTTTAVMSTNDQDLLSMAEILAKWQQRSPGGSGGIGGGSKKSGGIKI